VEEKTKELFKKSTEKSDAFRELEGLREEVKSARADVARQRKELFTFKQENTELRSKLSAATGPGSGGSESTALRAAKAELATISGFKVQAEERLNKREAEFAEQRVTLERRVRELEDEVMSLRTTSAEMQPVLEEMNKVERARRAAVVECEAAKGALATEESRCAEMERELLGVRRQLQTLTMIILEAQTTLPPSPGASGVATHASSPRGHIKSSSLKRHSPAGHHTDAAAASPPAVSSPASVEAKARAVMASLTVELKGRLAAEAQLAALGGEKARLIEFQERALRAESELSTCRSELSGERKRSAEAMAQLSTIGDILATAKMGYSGVLLEDLSSLCKDYGAMILNAAHLADAKAQAELQVASLKSTAAGTIASAKASALSQASHLASLEDALERSRARVGELQGALEAAGRQAIESIEREAAAQALAEARSGSEASALARVGALEVECEGLLLELEKLRQREQEEQVQVQMQGKEKQRGAEEATQNLARALAAEEKLASLDAALDRSLTSLADLEKQRDEARAAADSRGALLEAAEKREMSRVRKLQAEMNAAWAANKRAEAAEAELEELRRAQSQTTTHAPPPAIANRALLSPPSPSRSRSMPPTATSPNRHHAASHAPQASLGGLSLTQLSLLSAVTESRAQHDLLHSPTRAPPPKSPVFFSPPPTSTLSAALVQSINDAQKALSYAAGLSDSGGVGALDLADAAAALAALQPTVSEGTAAPQPSPPYLPRSVFTDRTRYYTPSSSSRPPTRGGFARFSGDATHTSAGVAISMVANGPSELQRATERLAERALNEASSSIEHFDDLVKQRVQEIQKSSLSPTQRAFKLAEQLTETVSKGIHLHTAQVIA